MRGPWGNSGNVDGYSAKTSVLVGGGVLIRFAAATTLWYNSSLARLILEGWFGGERGGALRVVAFGGGSGGADFFGFARPVFGGGASGNPIASSGGAFQITPSSSRYTGAFGVAVEPSCRGSGALGGGPLEVTIMRGGIFACGTLAVAGSLGGTWFGVIEVPVEEIGTAKLRPTLSGSMLRALMSCALTRVVLITEVGRAAFPPSGAGDFAAGTGGNVLRPISLIIGKGVINGGGPNGDGRDGVCPDHTVGGGATKPVRCLLAGGGSDVGATVPAAKVSWYLPGLGHGRVGIGAIFGAVGIAFGGGLEGGVGSVSAVARMFSRWRTVVGFSHISPAVRRSRRSTMASFGIAHCVVTAKLRLW